MVTRKANLPTKKRFQRPRRHEPFGSGSDLGALGDYISHAVRRGEKNNFIWTENGKVSEWVFEERSRPPVPVDVEVRSDLGSLIKVWKADASLITITFNEKSRAAVLSYQALESE